MGAKVAQELRLGELFVREGLVTQEQLNEGLAEARSSGTRIGYALVHLGFVAEEELTRMLARQYRVPAVDLEKVTVDPKILKLISPSVAQKHLVLPLRRVGRTLTVAMTNPTDFSAIDDLKFITKLDIEPVSVLSVVTFYPYYRQENEKLGKVHVRVCRTLSCALMGAYKVGDELERKLGCKMGSTREDGSVTLEYAECLASCDTGPVVLLDEKLYENLHKTGIDGLVQEARRRAEEKKS